MKTTTCLVFFLMLWATSAAAQFVSPVPVIETEIREKSSVKMRSIELDRVKREAKRTSVERPGPAAVNNFLEIKEDFEKIQKLQSAIVAVYTTGKRVNHARIAALAADLNQSAARLKENLFPPQDKNQNTLSAEMPPEKTETLPAENLESLIVALDNAIGSFVGNPIFLSKKKPDQKEKERAVSDLTRVIGLSAALKNEAKKKAAPSN